MSFRWRFHNALGRHSGQPNVEGWFDLEGSALLFSLHASSKPISHSLQTTLHYFFWSGVKMESQVLKYSMVGALTTKTKELNQSRGKATVLRDASLSLNKPGIRTVE